MIFIMERIYKEPNTFRTWPHWLLPR